LPCIFFGAIIGVIVFVALSQLLLDPHQGSRRDSLATLRPSAKERAHHEREGKGGEAGLDFGHRVGRALFNPSSPAHACMGRHSGVKPPACQRSRRGGSDRKGRALTVSRPPPPPPKFEQM